MPTYPLHQLCKFIKTQNILISQTFFQLYDHKTKKAKKLKKYHAFHNVQIFNMHFRKSSKSSKIYHRNKGCMYILLCLCAQSKTLPFHWLGRYTHSLSVPAFSPVSLCLSVSLPVLFLAPSVCSAWLSPSPTHGPSSASPGLVPSYSAPEHSVKGQSHCVSIY